MPLKIKPILITSPHAAQKLFHTEKPDERAATFGNQLFTLRETYGRKRNQMTFTGEELSSLALQWLAYAETQRINEQCSR